MSRSIHRLRRTASTLGVIGVMTPFMLCPQGRAASAASLTVTLSGFAGHKGQIKVGVFDRADGWPTDRGANTGKNVALADVAGDSVTVVFDDLRPGWYAVGAYQDANGNNRLDKNFLGVPKERWGVSRNVHPSLRAPRFDEARFELPPSGCAIAIVLHK